MSYDVYIPNTPDILCCFLLGLEISCLKITMVSLFLGFYSCNYSQFYLILKRSQCCISPGWNIQSFSLEHNTHAHTVSIPHLYLILDIDDSVDLYRKINIPISLYLSLFCCFFALVSSLQ